MKEIISHIVVIIHDIEVDEFYYSFSYDVIINGKRTVENDHYESDHVWGSSKEDRRDFRAMLKGGEALNIVLELISH